MLPLLLAAQIGAIVDSTYSSLALREVVARAAERNRIAPAALQSYDARVESEIAVVRRRPDGDEAPISIEQSRSTVHWRRDGAYDQHITGYRARHSGPGLSALAVLRRAWTVPVLYGNRLALFFGLDSSATAPCDEGTTGDQCSGRRGIRAVHPFAGERESLYRFTGGDTIAVISTPARTIPIVRVLVEPAPHRPAAPTVVFRGEIDVDASRGEIVRLRGHFVTITPPRAIRERVVRLPVEIVAFVELVSVEVNGRYWLPSYQRIEAQVAVMGMRGERSSFRVVSRFREHRVEAAQSSWLDQTGHSSWLIAHRDVVRVPSVSEGVAWGEDSSSDALVLKPHRLTLAPADSLERFGGWWLPLGQAVAGLRADDFLDVAPEGWRLTRSARLAPRRFGDLVHFNRVEGWATGNVIEWVPRGAEAGVAVRGSASWAWTEGALRGQLEATRLHGAWIARARAGRSLDVTDDFNVSADSGGTLLGALVSVDDHDYVDRRGLSLTLAPLAGLGAPAIRVDVGVSNDRLAPARLDRGVWLADSSYRPNRGVAEGTYGRATVTIDVNPDVTASAVGTGVGGGLRFEAAAGTLDWRRAELRVVARQTRGAFSHAARLDAGMLWSPAPPPQQLFEVGRAEGLAGYGYKVFAGDRATLFRWRGTYDLPMLRSPLRVAGCPCLPSPSPAFAIGLQLGIVRQTSEATRRSVGMLGSVEDVVGRAPVPVGAGTPIAAPTGGLRTSVEIGLRFLGGGVGVGFARPIDRAAAWRPVVSLSRGF